jgi:hypothetical protein
MCLAVAMPSVCGRVLCAWVVCLHQPDSDHGPCCCPTVVRNKRFRPQVHRKRPFELEMVLVGLPAHCSLHSTTHFICRSCPKWSTSLTQEVYMHLLLRVCWVAMPYRRGPLPRLFHHFMSLTPCHVGSTVLSTQALPANSTTTVSLEFRKPFIKLNEHAPDANRGLDVGCV